ncbi:FkbH like protein [Desulfamplus magnetovallimortis]|uniref:FkbH like protein n=1 Tax=Desulfamplus magnetovallimortis TaxID=1246637 RepID=A0A1W1HKS2_9BACT|nr:HAD-IIIC family phosphatase [Desulfamplus magnetovallimortis]SLM33107.1 FkbH like protein [Desulfamplus magnetovallimortis]
MSSVHNGDASITATAITGETAIATAKDEKQKEAIIKEHKERKIKCVVWDLDNTLWNGTLLEDNNVTLRPEVKDAMAILDKRGILQSIASKNEHELAMEKLKELGIDEYFLYPQINWGPKSASIDRIAKDINIGIDTLAFVDDQSFEREEVAFALPSVICIDALEVDKMLKLPEFNPKFITEDSGKRRKMYLADIARKQVEEHFEGPQDAFLSTLEMVLTIGTPREEDLKRAEELTQRTNQLNTTGYTYSHEELDFFRHSDKHRLIMAGLDDKYGTYGKIGLVLIECTEDTWLIKLLLMSCRVMTRGVGTVLINYVRNEARKNGVKLVAEMIKNDRNRMMYMTYKFNHFKEVDEKDDLIIFENDLTHEQAYPDYLTLKFED